LTREAGAPLASYGEEPGRLILRGPLDAAAASRLWPKLLRAAGRARGKPLCVDVSGAQVGTAGAALLAAVLARHGQARLEGAGPDAQALVAQAGAPGPPSARNAPWTFTGVTRVAIGRGAGGMAFIGESVVAAVTFPRRRRQLRLPDLFRVADQAGVRAIPLVLLLGYLMGLILAFQSSIPLRRFGADLFVVNAVGLSLSRELGPLLSAIILAGRTGSAFAAELGTMKVNEELAALETLGISTMTMLVLPRLVAAVLVMPVLCLLLEAAGLLGMLTVMEAFGFPLAAVTGQLGRAVHPHDFWSGLFKALVFGAVIAAIGCRAGLATGIGPRAVGQAATAAVVGGIVATILLDGLFAIVYFRLGL
jgi:phospholipid/cholesterol/gamma-HCH transport system permease protein